MSYTGLIQPTAMTSIEEVIDDTTPLINKVYSSDKVQSEVDSKVDLIDESYYQKDNIVGTVSATGTYPNLVPTGAIMESGSNANGEYVKYANGWMICVYSTTANPSTLFNNVFGSTAGAMYRTPVSWTFPAVYATPPKIMAVGGGHAAVVEVSPPNTSNVVVYPYTSGNGNSVSLSFTATGRWK